MGDSGQDTTTPNKKERRRRLRSALETLRQRAEQACGTIRQADGLLERISDVVENIREFAETTETRQLVPARARRQLNRAVDRLDQSKGQTAELVDACDKLQKVLNSVDKVLAGGFSLGTAALISGLLAAGAGIAIGVTLAFGVTVIIQNENCGDIELTGIPNVIPGLRLPNIADGATERVELPDSFQVKLTVYDGRLEINALAGGISGNIGDLDLSGSTWDGTPLADLLGQSVSVGGDFDHLLILRC